ncbi:hypothetical protein [Sphingorhabdus sp. Alg231-15]|uniref:hypothetical protein n=1 Tax=Sphingorhabdus sp. Alg231-15 TaxID=1922222 RepID=UPI000D55B56B
MGKPKRESVSVSFHYLLRDNPDEDEGFLPFTQEDFDQLLSDIESQPEPDMGDPLVFDRVRLGALVPFLDMQRKSIRCVFGKFKAPYSGHSFDNSEKGKISAESVNQRIFNYILYLSNDGKLYVGAQYLGNYGGWLPLSLALKKMLGQPTKIASTSFRNDLIYLEGARPKELQVNIHRQPEKIAADPKLATRAMFALQRDEKGDTFEQDARSNLLPLLGQSRDKIRKKVLESLHKNGLTEINDEEIEKCVLIADVNGREKRFYFLDQINVATRFPIEVTLNEDGHPLTKPTREKMYALLEREIIEKLSAED